MSEKKVFKRLPTNVKPTNYNLHLKTDFGSFKFYGKCTVTVDILQPTDTVILNSYELSINVAKLELTSSQKTLTAEVVYLTEDETLKLVFTEILPVGNATLFFEYDGSLNDKLKGFYRSKYTAIAGEEDKYCAVTQFESTDARRCFPCWDEPAIKATFDITLVVDSDRIALSNMPVKEEKIENGLKTVSFEQTPIMSTYLVAVVVGYFDYIEDTSSDGVLVRVYTPPGKKEQGRFSLYVATKVLPYYKDYFQIAYPLPKIDLIAISEMACGAMENWGLVTYRDSYILIDEENSSAASRQHVALVVGHELAHQWFGNLVTMEWWTHLWLNEGYASFVEYLCVSYLFPDYDIWTQFATDVYSRALELDALKSSHPIEVPVGHPSEIDEIFDEISYSKGASVIRMLHKYIGDDMFRKGMNVYLSRHQYGNTFTEDLWVALEDASQKPIKKVMSTWTKQMGFPLITIESSVQEANNVRTMVISQRKFCTELDRNKQEETLWMVPLSFAKSGNLKEDCYSTMLEMASSKISIPNVLPEEWVKLNPGISVGYYRIKYPSDLLKQIIPSVSDKTLSPLDRLGLLDDLFAMVQVGESRTIDVLELMSAMRDEDNYTVWTTISSCLIRLQYLLQGNTDFAHLFDAYGLELMNIVRKKVGFQSRQNENHLDTLLRSLVLSQLVRFEDEELLKNSIALFTRHCDGTEILQADTRGVVYRAAISSCGKSAYDSLLKLFMNTDLQEEKYRICRAFTGINDRELANEALEFAMTLNSGTTVNAIIAIASSKAGRDLTWEFIKKHWGKLTEKLASSSLLSRVVKYATENFASEQKAAEVEEFFRVNDNSGIVRCMNQVVETVRNNAAWLNRDKDSIEKYLRSNYAK